MCNKFLFKWASYCPTKLRGPETGGAAFHSDVVPAMADVTLFAAECDLNQRSP